MRRVALLSKDVSEKIAAGEVIERPGSVVKELIENALDAGATEVAVALAEGGRALIEVLDNGHGMSKDDLKLSVERHATSKLTEFDDLERLATLGFRGEALPSISAVSDLSVVSREKGSERAWELDLTRSRDVVPVTYGHFLGANHGTCVRAAGLFSRVPARLKFLKSPRAETAFVREWIERLALTKPGTGFRFTHDDRTVVDLRPATRGERVRSFLTDESDLPLSELTHSENGIKGTLYWLPGSSSPQTRRLVQIVNGRVLKDRVLTQAMLQPFRQALLPGQFPALALFLEVDSSTIDVNIHPTKTEVRFANQNAVFQFVSGLGESLLAKTGSVVTVASRAESPTFTGTLPPFLPDFKPQEFFPQPGVSSSSERPPLQFRLEQETPALFTRDAFPFLNAPFLGSVFSTYLLFDLGDTLGLVDQHAAHERVRYEKLKFSALEAKTVPERQELLIAESVTIRAEDANEIESRLPLLASLGFDAELFSDTSVLFRGIPAVWGTENLKIRLSNLIERLKGTHPKDSLLLDAPLFETLASEACHSSVRAGDRVDEVRARQIVTDLFASEHPWNCPHGRPTLARVPKSRFEEWFQRSV